MKIKYVDWKPSAQSLSIVERADELLTEYELAGYQLSLRQLYYRFVAENVLPNTEKSYKNLGDIISKARDAGLLDWDQLVDRGREARIRPVWSAAGSFLSDVADQFSCDLWKQQETLVEVWVEKAALEEIVEQAAARFGVTTFSCRGYVSASAMHEAAMRIRRKMGHHERVVILHLGDHDPSGIDMTRDIQDRLSLYLTHWSSRLDVKRIALSMDQVEEHDCPPNPAKVTDSRFAKYQDEYGDDSWELDALEPSVLDSLIQDSIRSFLDEDIFNARVRFEKNEIKRLHKVAKTLED